MRIYKIYIGNMYCTCLLIIRKLMRSSGSYHASKYRNVPTTLAMYDQYGEKCALYEIKYE